MPSSRGLTPSSDGKPQNSSNTSPNANTGGDSRTATGGPGRHRASRAGARSVSKLTPAQLARKRANDREAQRAIRQRTKEHIDHLEREIQELKSQRHGPWEVEQRNRELEGTVLILRQQLEDLRMQRDAALVGQGVPLSMGNNGEDMDWPMGMSMAYDEDAMTSFGPNQPMGVSRAGDLTETGNDIVTVYANKNPGPITPHPSESPTAGNFLDMDATGLNYEPLPGEQILNGLSGDMATTTWTDTVTIPFQMGDPNMFSPQNKYLSAEDVPYPYPGVNIKYELSPTPIPNQPQRMQTPQPMRQAQSSLSTPSEQEMQKRRQRAQQQRPFAPLVEGIPIAPAPAPPAHLQRLQPSFQTLPPIQAEQQLQQQRQLQQAQQSLQRRSPPQSSQQQMPGNMQMRSPRQGQRGRQPSIPYFLRTPTFLPPADIIDSLLHSALAQHRACVRRGGTNHRAPDFSSLLSFNNLTFPNPLPATGGPPSGPPGGGDPSPLSSAISKAIQVVGFRGIATQAAVLYSTHCFLRWQAAPGPETYARIPYWLRPGEMQLQVPHSLWVSQLVWRGLREWITGNGGKYGKDEFVFAYARNLEVDWKGGRRLTDGNLGREGLAGFGEGVFELDGNGELVMTPQFEAKVRELSSWGLRGEFFVLYPELRELVNRARD